MNRKMLAGAGLAGAVLLAVPSTALAQLPPDPPATFYGPATGATAGQGVIAIVTTGGGSTVCGAGSVLSDASGVVYVVDVASNAQIPGCGASGRQVQFYFTPTPSQPGKLANETASWTGAGPKQQALTPGKALTLKQSTPMVASDKSN